MEFKNSISIFFLPRNQRQGRRSALHSPVVHASIHQGNVCSAGRGRLSVHARISSFSWARKKLNPDPFASPFLRLDICFWVSPKNPLFLPFTRSIVLPLSVSKDYQEEEAGFTNTHVTKLSDIWFSICWPLPLNRLPFCCFCFGHSHTNTHEAHIPKHLYYSHTSTHTHTNTCSNHNLKRSFTLNATQHYLKNLSNFVS